MPDLTASANTDEATTAPSPIPTVLDAPAVVKGQNPYADALAAAQQVAMQLRQQQASAADNSVE